MVALAEDVGDRLRALYDKASDSGGTSPVATPTTTRSRR
jgi:hypothetical protein